MQNKVLSALPGMAITGFVGFLIGAQFSAWYYPIVIALVGVLIGFAVSSFGGNWFFLFVVMGALLGGLLATYLNGTASTFLGAEIGGAIGGFLGVNVKIFKGHL